MLIVTTDAIPGYDIRAICGEVFGLTVRWPGAFAGATGGLFNFNAREMPGFTATLVQSRNEAMARMVEEARGRLANAIVGMRFDVGSHGESCTEVCAYGTAVRVMPITDEAKLQYDAMVRRGFVPPLSGPAALAAAPPMPLPPAARLAPPHGPRDDPPPPPRPPAPPVPPA